MSPVIYKIGTFVIGGYGLMLTIGFFLSYLLGEREFKRINVNSNLAFKLIIIIVPISIVGAKIFFILENLDHFFKTPGKMLFSGTGLSAYGGFIFAFAASYLFVKNRKEPFLKLADAVAPSLAIGYCFGRFGCHVEGDGCYGIATSSFWGTAYPNGIAPTTATVFPTPLFEVFFSFLALGLLLKFRKKEWPHGRLLFFYLVLNGLPRFLVEFIRTNPKMIFFLTQAQVIGIILTIIGITGFMRIKENPVKK